MVVFYNCNHFSLNIYIQIVAKRFHSIKFFALRFALATKRGFMSLDMTEEKYWNNLINQSLLRFCLLKVLEKEELHAYVVPQKIDEFSRGYCASPSAGTLYTTLANLEKEGYLSSRVTTRGHTKKLYKLTTKGKKALQAATKSWSRTTFLIAKSVIYNQW